MFLEVDSEFEERCQNVAQLYAYLEHYRLLVRPLPLMVAMPTHMRHLCGINGVPCTKVLNLFQIP